MFEEDNRLSVGDMVQICKTRYPENGHLVGKTGRVRRVCHSEKGLCYIVEVESRVLLKYPHEIVML